MLDTKIVLSSLPTYCRGSDVLTIHASAGSIGGDLKGRSDISYFKLNDMRSRPKTALVRGLHLALIWVRSLGSALTQLLAQNNTKMRASSTIVYDRKARPSPETK